MQITDSARRGTLGAAAALRATLEASAIPYGYTLTIFSSGTLIARVRGTPSVAEIFLFVAGGIAAFLAVALIAARASPGREPAPVNRAPPLLHGGLAWVAVGGGVGASALVAELPTAPAWLAGSFVATGVFFLGSSVQLAFAGRARLRRREPSEP